MQVIIVRHGDEKTLRKVEEKATERRKRWISKWREKRAPGSDKKLKRLDQEANNRSGEFEQFGKFIDTLSLKQPVFVFSSPSQDVERTKTVVLAHLHLGADKAITLNELSDSPRSDFVESILNEEALKPQEIETAGAWVLIGHHPRLSQFLTRVTGTRQRPLGRLHAACVSVDDPTRLRLGQGKIEWRYPVLDVEGDKLGPKLQSKMIVGALLAGFDFTALLELLKEPEKTPVIKGTSLLTAQRWDYIKFWEWNNLQWTIALNSLAILCLSVALVLFIACVYIFDILAMPEGFLVPRYMGWVETSSRGQPQIEFAGQQIDDGR